MIDTHSHISTNIGKLDFVVLSGSNIEDSRNNIEVAKSDKRLKAAIGIHPQEVGDNFEALEKMMCDEVVAVGECGLEFTDGVDREKQIKLFESQIELSIKHNKPLIVHSRKASDETLEILKKYNCRGVIHCYTGGIKRIKNVPESFYFGIDGNLTYESGLQEVIKNIPKDRLVLETDSPFLTPIPHRGEINRPEWVEFVYQEVARIWEMSFEETEKIIDDNARKLFQIV
jgi:TatD DNase family protein